MISDGIPLETVSKYTEIPIDELSKLI